MTRETNRALHAAPLLLLLLTGCGDDRPVYGPPPPPASAAQTTPEAAPAPAGPSDPLASDADTGQTTSDPLLSPDPLQGQVMPTQHSHWLRGYLRNGQLTVLLNSGRLGAFYGPVDRDITMRLHKGMNTVTFIFQPRAANSSAQMDVVESEHNPPIAPLVTYQSQSVTDQSKIKPLPQTFRFIAK